jgi:hypothetical protein
MWLLKKDSEFF